MLTVVIVAMGRLCIHVMRRIRSIPVVAWIVLRRLVHSPVHGGRHGPVHVHLVASVHVRIRIRDLLLSLDVVIILFLAILLDRVHAVVLISLPFIVLLLFRRELLNDYNKR
jgi:hypothetical protein